MAESNTYFVKAGVGEDIRCQQLTHCSLVYAGMNSEDTFSLGYIKGGVGVNLFFPSDSEEIEINRRHTLRVHGVTKDEIELEYLVSQ